MFEVGRIPDTLRRRNHRYQTFGCCEPVARLIHPTPVTKHMTRVACTDIQVQVPGCLLFLNETRRRNLNDNMVLFEIRPGE